MSEENNDKKKKKGMDPWAIGILILAVLLIMIVVAWVICNGVQTKLDQLEHNREYNKRIDDQKNGIVINEGKNEYKNIDVTGNIVDKDGNIEINKIVNNSDINLSKDLEMAIKIENAGSLNDKITVNGTTALGGLDVDNGFIKFRDLNGELHSVSTENAIVTYGGTKLSDNVINLMDNVSYNNGKVIFDDIKTVISYDSGNAMIKYTNKDGIEYGSKSFNNLIEKDGKIYSGDTQLKDEYQGYFKTFDKMLDNKYRSTANVDFFEKKVDEQKNQTDQNQNTDKTNEKDKNNSNPDVNLKDTQNKNKTI